MSAQDERARMEFEQLLSDTHRRVRYWIAQTQTRVCRSVLLLITAGIYESTVKSWPDAMSLEGILTSSSADNSPNSSVRYLVILWLLFSTLDALWLGYWWIETTPQTDRLLGRFSRLKFVLLRAVVVKPGLALVAAFVYGPMLGILMPSRASLDDVCSLSLSLFSPRTLGSLLWAAPSVSFWTIWQTALCFLITVLLMLWIDGNYCFAHFIDPSKQTLKHLDLWLKLPRKRSSSR